MTMNVENPKESIGKLWKNNNNSISCWTQNQSGKMDHISIYEEQIENTLKNIKILRAHKKYEEH